MVGKVDPFRWSEIADFEPIFARSASAVTPSEKSWININSPLGLRAFQWAQDEQRIVPKPPPQTMAQKRSVQNLNNKLW